MGCPALQAGRSGASSTDWARRLAATAGSLKGTLPPTAPHHRALTMINLTSKDGGCQVVPAPTRRLPMCHLPRRQVTQAFGQRFLAPVTCRPNRRPHNSPRPFPTFRQTARAQQPPRRRKSPDPNVPTVLPQQVKHAQLMRRLPAIHQLNPRRDGHPHRRPDAPGAAPPTARPGQSLRSRNRNLPTPSLQQHRGLPSIRHVHYGFASTNRPVPAFRPEATPAPSKAPSPATCRPYS